MTYEQRFFTDRTYAASTIGCPKMLHSINRNEFKKTEYEKGKLATAKMQFKQRPESRIKPSRIGVYQF